MNSSHYETTLLRSRHPRAALAAWIIECLRSWCYTASFPKTYDLTRLKFNSPSAATAATVQHVPLHFDFFFIGTWLHLLSFLYLIPILDRRVMRNHRLLPPLWCPHIERCIVLYHYSHDLGGQHLGYWGAFILVRSERGGCQCHYQGMGSWP